MAEEYLVNPYDESEVDNSSALGSSLGACSVVNDNPPCLVGIDTPIDPCVCPEDYSPCPCPYDACSCPEDIPEPCPYDACSCPEDACLDQPTPPCRIPDDIGFRTVSVSVSNFPANVERIDISTDFNMRSFSPDSQEQDMNAITHYLGIDIYCTEETIIPDFNFKGITYTQSEADYLGGYYFYGISDIDAVDGERAVVAFDASGYSITYHANGGTPEPENLTGQTNLPSSLPTVSKANFSFDGWYTDSTFTTPAVAGAEISADTDLYAKFTRSHITLDLSTIGLPGGTHSIQMKLSDDWVTKRDSELSNAVSYVVSEWEPPVQDGEELTITQAKQITQIGNILYIDIDTFSVTGTATHGTVLTGTGTFPEGKTVTIDGEPDDGYIFSHLVVNGETYSTLPLTFTVTEDTSFEIIFEAAPYVSHSAED